MMSDQQHDLHVLQQYLRDTGRYHNDVDGDYGPLTRAAILQALEDGPDTALTLQDYLDSGGRLGCNPAYVLAFAEVEAHGAGFEAGYPKILFEPHIFSRLTQHRFDASHPAISYPKWGMRPYPKGANERYQQLLDAVGLDVYGGFASASYGKFQLMGFNHEACGYDNPWALAIAMAFDEPTQLKAFESFIRRNNLLQPLQNGQWVALARGYNGPAYAANAYDKKLAQAARKWEMQLEARA
jgi:hypothetical protein